MNIGLLVSELEDKEVKRICVGAVQAAKDKGVTLVIMPGKYLVSEISEENPYDYQQSALFDYAGSNDFDALIIDIDRIGKNVPILKKEALLKKLSSKPLLTLSEHKGFTSVNQIESDHDQLEQLGYEAVIDCIYYAENKEVPTPSPAQKFSFVEKSGLDSGSTLAKLGYSLLHRKYPSEQAYSIFAENAKNIGINTCGIMLYDKKVRNTIKYWWTLPEKIRVKGLLVNGKVKEIDTDNSLVETNSIISTLTENKARILVAGNLFVSEYQLGILVTEYTEDVLTDYYFVSLTSMLTGASRISYLEKELKRTNEELYEVQEELARDDSVLDHIGDQDYLTGGLNRRGFFAKAYDLLKEKFKPGSYAIVAYIHMESLKRINDMYGHEEGDRAVKKVADILEEVFEGSIYGRIRGNEFAVIEIAEDEDKADSIREAMSIQNAKLLSETTRYINHLQYSICEFGYEENLSLREMLKETDENLQRIKEA